MKKKEKETEKDITEVVNEINEKPEEKVYVNDLHESGINKNITFRKTVEPFSVYGLSVEDAKKLKHFTDDECGKKMNVALHYLLKFKDLYNVNVNILSQINAINQENSQLRKALVNLNDRVKVLEPKQRTGPKLYGRAPRP